jgi:hypothetical protein
VGEKREEEIPTPRHVTRGTELDSPDCSGAERAFGGFVPRYLAYTALYACG